MVRLFVIVVISLCLGCAQDRVVYYSMAPGNPLSVSMVNLIVNPKKYENRHIEVHGYLSSFGNLSLFLTKDHYDMMDHASSYYVENLNFKESAISEYCGGKYAIVQGDFLFQTYDESPGFYEIGNLKRIMVYEGEKLIECWPADT